MFKKLVIVGTMIATVIVAIPTQGVPLYCYTNYVQNGAFINTGSWTYENLAYRETAADDPCDPFGYTIDAAALKNPGDAISQTFTTSSTTAMSWSMSLGCAGTQHRGSDRVGRVQGLR